MCGSWHKSRGSWHVQQQNNNGSDSRKRIYAAMHMVGFIMEARGLAELGVAKDSDKSLAGLELYNIED